MAAGGSWVTQNKVRPGAYINFIGTPKALSSVGERGVVAAPLMLSWGANIVELTANDLVTGASLEKAGVQFTDAGALNLRLLLQSCAKAIIYRLNAETAEKASLTLNGLAVMAKYAGSFGNRISIEVEAPEVSPTAPIGDLDPVIPYSVNPSTRNSGTPLLLNTSYVVKTYVDGALKDTQKVENITDLVPNAFVEFGIAQGMVESTTAPESLTGGTDGAEPTDISPALAAFESYKFNILAISQSSQDTKVQAVQWVESLRKDRGIKVQCVLYGYNADSEAVIMTCQGYRMEDGTLLSAEEAVLAIASMEAGASITQSLSGAVIPGAVEMYDDPQTHEDIVDALNNGVLVLSRRGDGAIVIEKDQNTLHTFTPKHGYLFSKNRPVRVLDQIGNDIKDLYNKSYLGKVSNDDNGRSIFKNDLVSYFKTLEKMGAIQNFRVDDLLVLPGNDTDAVVVEVYVQPVDSMEKLYMTVNVEG